MRTFTTIATVIACLVVVPSHQIVASQEGGTAIASPEVARETPFEDRLEAAYAELAQSGVSAIVAVSHAGGPIAVREFGAPTGDGVPGDVTQVDLNSITKTVTGVVVLKLVDQGKVRLDETLAEVFPNVPEDKAAITVHQLLTHSAGVVRSIGSDEERLSKEDFLARAFATKLVSAPGEQYNYSNVGFSILAAIVEERSGKSYDAYLREEVLRGTGLYDTGYVSVYDEGRSLRSEDGRAIRAASWGGHDPYWNLIGNGGLISTAEEFIRFRQAMTMGRIVSPELVDSSQVPHVPEDETGTSFYGYGIVVQDHPEFGRVYWHDGGNDVFSTIWVDSPDQGDVIFVAAADSDEGDAFSVMSDLLKHLYGGVNE